MFSWIRSKFHAPRRYTKVLFIAGSFRQAEYWAAKWITHRRNWRYASGPPAVMGLSADTPVFLCGTYWKNPVAMSALEYVQMNGNPIFNAEDIS